MELKPAAKQPDKVLPEGWCLVPLSELLEFRNGANADKRAYGRGIPFINVLDVLTHSHIRADQIVGRVALPRSAIESFGVRRGDLVFNRTSETQGEVGLAAVYDDDLAVVFGGFVIRGRPKTAALDARYSGYGLRAPAVRAQVIARGQGAIRANVGQADLRQVLAPLPPLVEQRAIGEALRDVDALVHTLSQLIAKKRDLKQAAMQRLLSGRSRLPGFRGAWSAARLGDLGPFSKGRGIRRDEVRAEGYPCVRYGEIYTHHTDHVRQFFSFVSADIAMGSRRLRPGDLLFAGSGETAEEIGKCVAVLDDVEAYAGGDIVILSPRGHDSRFLGYLMNHRSIALQKANFGQGDAVVHISASNLARIHLRLPDVIEQRAIAQVLWDMDTEILAIEERLEKTRALKQGMMQALLTGRVRLAQPAAV